MALYSNLRIMTVKLFQMLFTALNDKTSVSFYFLFPSPLAHCMYYFPTALHDTLSLIFFKIINLNQINYFEMP